MTSRRNQVDAQTRPLRTVFGRGVALVTSVAAVSPRAAAGPLDLGGRFERGAGVEVDWDWRSALGSDLDDDLESAMSLFAFRIGLCYSRPG